VGREARLVRNHGFLNDGYWGHAASWNEIGVEGSSNLPGVDGRVINGSLLPGRLALEEKLTCHWSILTAFGDGAFFVYNWSDLQACDAVMSFGRDIVESGVPGIIVFNLHPANHAVAAPMHAAIHRLVKELGFAAMTFGAALDWFMARDLGRQHSAFHEMIPPFGDTGCEITDPSGRHAATDPSTLIEGPAQIKRRLDVVGGAKAAWQRMFGQSEGRRGVGKMS
jgi:hypothetical protein